MEPLDQIRLSRRGVFRAGAAVGAGALGSGLLATGTANAVLPPSPEFDLGATPHHLFGPKILHETHHSMQGFTFDDVNRRLFVVQAENGGSGADLVVNQVSASGAVLGSMTVKRAGHGVSIAAEPVGDITYIWIECDADQNNGDGRGTALARVQFKNIVRESIATEAKFFRGSDTITAAVDPVNKRLMVRRKENGSFYFSVWPLSKAREGLAADRLVHVKQPSYSRTFQGYTFYGQYAYLWYGDGQTNPDNINSTIRTVDLNTGEFTRDPAVTRAGESLVYREPEGMAIHRMDSGDLGLFFGFASRPGDGGDNRYANLYYKLLAG
ncbi:hypothetical protein [Kribbella ginsengisoli]|uniref:P68 RBP/TagC-like beta-propeller domain-containing protein n=1 Tax=Kribbella ginsengisoli TaxID=363865 RepID=A0ABP6YV46_9ACTN